jgi:hypothetical protein
LFRRLINKYILIDTYWCILAHILHIDTSRYM